MGKPSMQHVGGREGSPSAGRRTGDGTSILLGPASTAQDTGGSMHKREHDGPDDPGESSPQHAEPNALQERRKALGQIAFVRHSTSELAMQLRAEGSLKQPKVSLSQDHTRYPGSLYNHEQEKPPSRDVSSSLPHIPSSQEAPMTPQSYSVYEANLNGIGHPVVLRNQRTSWNGSRSAGELLAPSAGGGHIAQLLQLSPPPPHLRKAKLPMLHLSKGGAETASTSNDTEAEKPRPMKRFDTLPGAHGGPPPVVVIAKPLGQDTLNLWRGKRLTRLEMKVEQKLHVVRNNPVAKTDLQSRVHSYIQEKAQEQAERVALAELAAERREQKTLEFVGNRLKASGKAQAVSSSVSASADSASTSLFDRSTGKPRNDANPVPESSKPFWTGFVALAQKIGQLRDTLQLRSAEKRIQAQLLKASMTIQRHWRGFQGRRSVNAIRSSGPGAPGTTARAAKPAKREVLHVTPQMREQAVKKVMAFIEFSHGAAVLGYLRKRFREKNSAQALGNVTAAFWSAESVRSFRVQIIVSQWQAVEVRCIELAKKRMRSNIIGEISMPRAGPAARTFSSSGSALAPLLAEKRRQGSRSGVDDADSIRQAVNEALSKTFVNDRVVLEDLRPVPKPVKMAALQIFMQDRLQAYIAQLGVYWKKRAKYLVLARAATAKAMAISAMQETFGSSDPGSGGAEESPDLGNPGPFPRYRSLATLPELKALMQLGVAETPFFRSYMMRQKLQAYENELTQELADRFAEEDGEAIKEIAKRAKLAKVKVARESVKKDTLRSTDGMPRTKSFTLALLLHRWHTECNPRMQACLAKRIQLLNINLVQCLFMGKWMNHDDMGSKLMELRDG